MYYLNKPKTVKFRDEVEPFDVVIIAKTSNQLYMRVKHKDKDKMKYRLKEFEKYWQMNSSMRLLFPEFDFELRCCVVNLVPNWIYNEESKHTQLSSIGAWLENSNSINIKWSSFII